jgi:hypothetical protein
MLAGENKGFIPRMRKAPRSSDHQSSVACSFFPFLASALNFDQLLNLKNIKLVVIFSEEDMLDGIVSYKSEYKEMAY